MASAPDVAHVLAVVDFPIFSAQQHSRDNAPEMPAFIFAFAQAHFEGLRSLDFGSLDISLQRQTLGRQILTCRSWTSNPWTSQFGGKSLDVALGRQMFGRRHLEANP